VSTGAYLEAVARIILPPTGTRTTDHAARSQALLPLSYPGSFKKYYDILDSKLSSIYLIFNSITINPRFFSNNKTQWNFPSTILVIYHNFMMFVILCIGDSFKLECYMKLNYER
jgi:hypothetical protein